MRIVIDQFEAVAEALGEEAPAEVQAEEEARESRPPEPPDLEAAMREQAEQMSRIWAH